MVAGVAACTSSDAPTPEPPCVSGLTASCQAQYDPPTYDTIFTKILQPTCATGSGTCHTSDGAKAGLVFEDPDAAYAALLGKNGARARVLPGDPSCSLIMKRLTSPDSNYRMPQGPTPLSDPEICTFTKWIFDGAPR
jgi:hypothetical protein